MLVGIQQSVSNEQELRDQWLVETNLEIPDTIPYYLKVRFSEDADAPTLTVPSCCVLTSSGLNIQPATRNNGIGLRVLCRLIGAYA